MNGGQACLIEWLFRVSFFFRREYRHVEMPIVHI